jgi:hypothetical protein
MPMGKRLMLLIAALQTHYCIACEQPADTGKKSFCEFATYDNNIPPGLKIPIDLLINEDFEQPGKEPGINYSVYKVGAHWPDWDWNGEQTKSMPNLSRDKSQIQAESMPFAESVPPVSPPNRSRCTQLCRLLCFYECLEEDN